MYYVQLIKINVNHMGRHTISGLSKCKPVLAFKQLVLRKSFTYSDQIRMERGSNSTFSIHILFEICRFFFSSGDSPYLENLVFSRSGENVVMGAAIMPTLPTVPCVVYVHCKW